MKNNPQRYLGFILIGIGLLLVVTGINGLTRPDEFRSQTRIAALDDDYYELFVSETSAIKSETILSNVVTRLDLGSVWGNKHCNGRKLRMAEMIAQLRNHVDVRQVSNARLLDICATSEDPTEAALIANTVAEAYWDWRHDRRRKLTEFGIAELTKELEKINQQIKNSEDELERLRRELNIPSPEPEAGFLKTNFPAYVEAKRNLPELKNYERLITRRIKVEQEDMHWLSQSSIEILERAVPALAPNSRQRRLGRTFLVVGLACFGLGITLVLNSRAKNS